MAEQWSWSQSMGASCGGLWGVCLRVCSLTFAREADKADDGGGEDDEEDGGMAESLHSTRPFSTLPAGSTGGAVGAPKVTAAVVTATVAVPPSFLALAWQ